MMARIRLWSGLILFAYLFCHLVNHAFGLMSILAMNKAHAYLMDIWRTPPGTAILLGAFLAHFGNAAYAITTKKTMKMPAWEWAQLVSGLAIPLLIASHILGTRIAEEFLQVKPEYRSVMSILWVISPKDGIIQTAALVVAWVHGCVGLHFWLRMKPTYRAWRRPLLFAFILVPTLSLSGYIAAGFEILEEQNRDHMIAEIMTQANYTAESTAPLFAIQPWTYGGIVALTVLPFLLRAGRNLTDSRQGYTIRLPDGRKLKGQTGATILETFREHGVDHAAVCGGRGRCTTCRIRITTGNDSLAEPGEVEDRALSRIKALPGVRLACQVRPNTDVTVSPLLPASASAADGRRPGGLQGEERRVACLFIDMRGSTRLGELKLPYDVLFILNQFFAEMNQAITDSGGHYAQFNGDGLMALYGLASDDPRAAAQAAIRGGRAMMERVEKLNETLETELPFPLRVGIGIHFGDAIVGAMGPPVAQITSAIGDTINIAARLESLSKTHNAVAIVSEEAAKAAEMPVEGLQRHTVTVRGREEPVGFYATNNLSI